MTSLDSTQQVSSPSKQFAVLWWLIPILVFAITLRIQHLSEVGYLFDESFSLKMVEFPLDEMFDRINEDSHPPAFYLILKSWMSIFGSSPYSTRLLSVVFGIFAVIGVFLFVHEAYHHEEDETARRRAGFAAATAAILISLCPLHIDSSQLVRMYSMGTALTAISSWLLLRALYWPETRVRDWSLFTVTAIILAYTHYFGLFTVAIEYVFACGYLLLKSPKENNSTRINNLWPLFISAFFVWFVWSPWIPLFLYQRSHVNHAFWSGPLSWERIGSQLFLLFDLNLWRASSSSVGLIAAESCFVLLVILLLGRRSADLYIAMAAIGPILAAIVASLFMRSVFAYRYLQFAHIFVLITIAVLLSRLPTRLLRFGITSLVIVGMGFLSWRHYEIRERHAFLPGMKAAIDRFDEVRGPREVLICCNPMLFTSADIYSKNRDAIFVNGSARSYPFYQGTSVIRDDKYLLPTQHLGKTIQAVWTLDAQRWFNATWEVKMPSGWKKAGEVQFTEFYADIILRLYVRDITDHESKTHAQDHIMNLE